MLAATSPSAPELSPKAATFNQLHEAMTDALHNVQLRPGVYIKSVLDKAAQYKQIASA